MQFNKLVRLLLETPTLTSPAERHEDYPNHNKERYYYILHDRDRTKIDIFMGYSVFYYKSGIYDHYDFIDEQNEIYIARVYIENSNNEIISDSLWKYKSAKPNLMTDIIIQYILPKYNFIQSREEHTQYAMRLWIKLINYADNNGYKWEIFDSNNKCTSQYNTIELFNNNINNIWKDKSLIPRIYKN